jgi:hypothetical protein
VDTVACFKQPFPRPTCSALQVVAFLSCISSRCPWKTNEEICFSEVLHTRHVNLEKVARSIFQPHIEKTIFTLSTQCSCHEHRDQRLLPHNQRRGPRAKVGFFTSAVSKSNSRAHANLDEPANNAMFTPAIKSSATGRRCLRAIVLGVPTTGREKLACGTTGLAATVPLEPFLAPKGSQIRRSLVRSGGSNGCDMDPRKCADLRHVCESGNQLEVVIA